MSDLIDCAEQCTIPDGIELTEVPRPRHDWGDVFNCPNGGCGKSFMARPVDQPQAADD